MGESGRPLSGSRILVTREHTQAASFVRMLEEQGAEVVSCPLITFSPPSDWGPVDLCIRRIRHYDGILFTSVNAVRFFLQRMEARNVSRESLRNIPCYAIGPATASEMTARQIPVKAVPDRYQAEGMVALLEKERLEGKRFLFPRAGEAREMLPGFLQKKGAVVDLAVVYETRKAEENRPRLLELLTRGGLNYLTFTSTSTVRFFDEMVRTGIPKRLWQGIPAGCIGRVTADAAEMAGFERVLAAEESTLKGLVKAILDYEAKTVQPEPEG